MIRNLDLLCDVSASTIYNTCVHHDAPLADELPSDFRAMLGIRARKFLHRAIKTPAFARFVGAIKALPDPQDLNQGDLKRGRSPAGEFKPAADLPCHHDPVNIFNTPGFSQSVSCGDLSGFGSRALHHLEDARGTIADLRIKMENGTSKDGKAITRM